MLKSASKTVEKLFGVKVTRIASDSNSRLADLSPEMKSTIERVRNYSMTSLERLAAVCLAVEHVVGNEVPGAFVECGVWRGGSSMAAALTYLQLGREDVDLFLFDTFDGLTQPSEVDVHAATGKTAEHLLAISDRTDEMWCVAGITEVRQNLESTGYPTTRLHFIKGMVEETIPGNAPEQISVLRLDTDWFESTKHELVHLFPRLSKNGILIIDDYGAWTGARKATDEYFAAQNMKPFLGRIDDTGRIYVKS